jgi:UDP-N-acetyl-D-mannosaminuronic acid dehydrogenase
MHHLKSILIVGGGFVGVTLAAKLTKSPYHIIDILETNTERVLNLLNGETHIFEPNLDQEIQKALSAGTMNISDALSKTIYESVFVCIGTRQLSKDPKSMSELIKTCLSVSKNIAPNGALFIRSTVKVGTSCIVSAALKEIQRPDIKVYYAPERTAEGVALLELDELPQILAAESTESLRRGEEILKDLGFTVVKASKLEVAEFSKLVTNAWRDSIFGISNEIAMAAESLNLSISETLHLINFNYPRAKIPNPGPVGGPCLSKDTHILIDSLPEAFKTSSVLLKSRLLNENLDKEASKIILNYSNNLNKATEILIAGLAFKGAPRTNDIRNSFAVNILNEILAVNPTLKVRIWDPTLTDRDLGKLKKFRVANIDNYSPDIILIGNNGSAICSGEFSNFLSRNIHSSFVVDYWGVCIDLNLPLVNGYFFGEKLND